MYIALTQGSETILVNVARIVKVQADGSDSVLTLTDGNLVTADESYASIKSTLSAEPLIEVTGDNGALLIHKLHILTVAAANGGADSSAMLMTGETLALDETFSEITTLLA